uniref:NADH dehydrogenase [ubiquinone] 1 beta subcomplex subunit 6 n=1 Tax=Parascaris equorum TaxID=6256 RepID=A0A914S2B2_PAREQ
EKHFGAPGIHKGGTDGKRWPRGFTLTVDEDGQSFSGSDAPSHRINDPMSLELHMADERVRAAGLSPAEREWRMFAFI